MIDNLFKSILEVQSYSGRVERMTRLISETAIGFGAVVTIKDENIYVTKGTPLDNGYPCIVAHTDTVHDIVPDNEFKVSYDYTNRIIYGFNPLQKNFTGIGGDDKVGIYIALAAVRDFSNIKACFFKDEEIGCIGSGIADLNFFSDCMYILQCDRRGNDDFVTNINGKDISSQLFQDDIASIIKAHGYEFANGMTTDVGKLTHRNVGISCANMSCGYYNPHQPDEIIVVDDVNNTKNMVYQIISKLTDKYPFTAPSYKLNSQLYSSDRGYFQDFYQPKTYNNYDVDYFDETEFPFPDELINMTDEDICDYCLAYTMGYDYMGNNTYSYIDDELSVPNYIDKKDINFDEMYHMLDEEELFDVYANAEYIEKKRDFLKNKQEKKCCSCGTTKVNSDSKLYYEGMCYSCYNEKVFGW